MNPRFLPTFLLLLTLATQFGSPWVKAIDFTWEGENYRDVKVVEVMEDEVMLKSKKGEEIVVPRTSLVGLLASDAKSLEEAQKKGEANEERQETRERPVSQHELERAWIYGTASNGSREGFQVYSSDRALPRGKPSRSGKVREPKKTKSGAPIFNGLVWVKGLTTGENTQFDRVMWRDGYVETGGKRLPAFAASKPDVKVPVIAEKREWTNADGSKLTATLVTVKEGKGQFIPETGKPFVYELGKLSAEDQAFVKEAVEKRAKVVRQLQKDYPWLKVE